MNTHNKMQHMNPKNNGHNNSIHECNRNNGNACTSKYNKCIDGGGSGNSGGRNTNNRSISNNIGSITKKNSSSIKTAIIINARNTSIHNNKFEHQIDTNTHIININNNRNNNTHNENWS